MKERSRIWILMARKLSGEATPEEIAELERFQQQHPEMTYSLQVLTDLWKSHPTGDDTEAESDQAFNRHLTRMALRDPPPAEPTSTATGPRSNDPLAADPAAGVEPRASNTGVNGTSTN